MRDCSYYIKRWIVGAFLLTIVLLFMFMFIYKVFCTIIILRLLTVLFIIISVTLGIIFNTKNWYMSPIYIGPSNNFFELLVSFFTNFQINNIFLIFHTLIKKHNNEIVMQYSTIRAFAKKVIYILSVRLLLLILNIPYSMWLLSVMYFKSITQFNVNPYIYFKMLITNTVSNKYTTSCNIIFISDSGKLFTNGLQDVFRFFKNKDIDQYRIATYGKNGKVYTHKAISFYNSKLVITETTKQKTMSNSNVSLNYTTRDGLNIYGSLCNVSGINIIKENNILSRNIIIMKIYYFMLEYKNNKELPCIEYKNNKIITTTKNREDLESAGYGTLIDEIMC